MPYSTADARQHLLDDLASSVDELGVALAALGDAYERLDEQTADRMEADLFRPVQVTFARAQRVHGGFAERHGLPTRTFAPSAAGRAGQHGRSFLEAALEAVEEADQLLVEIQDSMMPVEVGDAELRAGLADLRERLTPLPERGAALLRTLGR
jgi:hypothetical protein